MINETSQLELSCKAVKCGDSETVKNSLGEYPDLSNVKDLQNKNTLCEALSGKNNEIIKEFVDCIRQLLNEKQGQDINWLNVVRIALRKNSESKIVKAFCKLNEEPGLFSKDVLCDALSYALHHEAIAESGNITEYCEIVKILLGKDLIGIKDHEGKTALDHELSSKNNEIIKEFVDCIKQLLDRKSYPYPYPYQGIDIGIGWIDVLYTAVKHENSEIVKMLLDEKPNLMVMQDAEGKTALDHALSGKNSEIIRKFVDCIKQLLNEKQGQDIGYQDIHWRDVLYTAVKHENSEIVKMLLNKKPNLMVMQDAEGKTILGEVLCCKEQNIIEIFCKCISNLIKKAAEQEDDNISRILSIIVREDDIFERFKGDDKIIKALSDRNKKACDDINLLLQGKKMIYDPNGNVFCHQNIESIKDIDHRDKGWTLLHCAAYGADVELVRSLIKYGADVTVHDSWKGYTPLHIVSKNGNAEIAELLLGAGAFSSFKDLGQNTPMQIAVQCGKKEVVDVLLKKTDFLKVYSYDSSDIDVIRKDDGYNLLHIAAVGGFTEIGKMLLGKRQSLIRGVCGNDGGYDTPLHTAVWNRHAEFVEMLLDQDKEILLNGKNKKNDQKDDTSSIIVVQRKFGETAWDWAINSKDERIIDLLLNHINALYTEELCDDDLQRAVQGSLDLDTDPLYYAICRGHIEIVKVFVNKKKLALCNNQEQLIQYLKEALSYAVVEGHCDVIKMLFSEKEDLKEQQGWLVSFLGEKINYKEYKGDTLLHIAAKKGYGEIVGMLLKKWRGLVNMKNANGYTILEIAACYGHHDVVKVVLDLANSEDNTPLHVAASMEPDKIFCGKNQLCGDLFYDKELFNKELQDLYYEAYEQCYKSIKIFLNKQLGDIDKKNLYGCTPLHLAVRSGNKAAVKVLLENGADFNIQDKGGKTPLSYADESDKDESDKKDRLEIIELLKNARLQSQSFPEEVRKKLKEKINEKYKEKYFGCDLSSINVNNNGERVMNLRMTGDKIHIEPCSLFKIKNADVSRINICNSQGKDICICVKKGDIKYYEINPDDLSKIEMTISWKGKDGKQCKLILEFNKENYNIKKKEPDSITVDDIGHNQVVRINDKSLSEIYGELQDDPPYSKLEGCDPQQIKNKRSRG
jgi:ankyrin repeat protein